MNATEQAIQVVYKTLFPSLWLVSLLLNFSNTALLARTVQLRSTWSNILLLSLSVSDCFLVITGGTIAVAALFRTTILREFIGLCYFQGFSLNLCITFSNILVTFIAVDRYIAVFHPFCYNTKILNQPPALCSIRIAVSLLAIGSAVLAGLPFFHSPSYEPLQPPIFCWPPFSHGTGYIDSPRNRIVVIVHISFKLILMLIVLMCSIGTCGKLFMEQRILRNSVAADDVIRNSRTRHSVQVNLAKLTAAIAIIFFMCTSPYIVVISIQLFTIYSNPSTIFFTFLVLLLSTLLDPLLFALVKVTIRRAYIETIKTLLYWLCCCKMAYKPNGIDLALGLTRPRNNLITTIGMRVLPGSLREVSHAPQSIVAGSSSQALAENDHSLTSPPAQPSQPLSTAQPSQPPRINTLHSLSRSQSFQKRRLRRRSHSSLFNRSHSYPTLKRKKSLLVKSSQLSVISERSEPETDTEMPVAKVKIESEVEEHLEGDDIVEEHYGGELEELVEEHYGGDPEEDMVDGGELEDLVEEHCGGDPEDMVEEHRGRVNVVEQRCKDEINMERKWMINDDILEERYV